MALTAVLRASSGVTPAPEELAAFGGSVVDWPAFPDSAAALRGCRPAIALGVITNCDDDLFAASNRRLGVEFDVRDHRPAGAALQAAAPATSRSRSSGSAARATRILHVAQSLFHDHVPAKALGLTTVWVNRRHDRPGSGATPPADATPDLVVPDMATFAALATA